MRFWMLVVVALAAGCDVNHSTEPDAGVQGMGMHGGGVPVGTCSEFRHRTTAVVVTTAPDFSVYECRVQLDPGVVLPQSLRQREPGVIAPLLAYRRRPDAEPEAFGVYGFRGDESTALPERHPDEPCEWITIDRTDCVLRQP